MRSHDRRAIRRAGWLEIGAWCAGCLLLALYGSGTWLSSIAYKEGVATFRPVQLAKPDDRRQAPQRRERSTPGSTSHGEAGSFARRASSAEPASLLASVPDMALWSASRIADYASVPGASSPPEALLRIDALGLEVPVYLGANEWNLNRGAAIVDGTALVGESGNTGIAGHRDGYFRALKDIRLGEIISLQTLDERLQYRVTAIQVVRPDAVEVLAPTKHRVLTLVTCYPFYHVGPAPERFIVRAEKVPSDRIRRASAVPSTQLAHERDAAGNEYQQQAARANER